MVLVINALSFCEILVLLFQVCVFCNLDKKSIHVTSDYFEGFCKDDDHDELQQLFGNVKVEYDGYEATMDAVKYFPEKKIAHSVGQVNVKNQKEDVEVCAGDLLCDLDKHKITMTGDIIGRKKDAYLYTNLCEYDLDKKFVKFTNGGMIKSKDNVLRCNHGTIDLRSNVAKLFDKIDMDNDSIHATCKLIKCDISSGMITLSKDVTANIKNSDANYITTQHEGIYNARSGIITFNKC